MYLGNEKKIQQGEIMPDGSIRLFDEYEKKKKDEDSWKFFKVLFGLKK